MQRKDRFRQLEDSLAYVRERHGDKVSLSLAWVLMRPTCSIDTVRETWRFAQRYRAPISINLVHYSLPYFAGMENHEVQFAPEDLHQQMRVRAVFDPAWLLNPAKVFPLEGRLHPG